MLRCLSSNPSRSSAGIVALVLLSGLAGCAGRPTSAVLQPVQLRQTAGQKVELLSVTNRMPDIRQHGFGNTWGNALSYERYGFSIPPDRKGVTINYPSKPPNPQRQFVVTGRQELTRDELIDAATRSANFDGTIAVFVHGYNNSFPEALYRTAQMAADANTLSAPILFSWPSASSVTGYVTDRDAALYSRRDLSGFLDALAKSPKIKRIALFGHSMGGFLSMEAVTQLKLEKKDDVIAKLQILLAAPDIDVDVFRSQLMDIGRLPNPITLLVSKTDRVLTISSVLGGERPRVGRIDINDPIIRKAAHEQHINLVDISSVESSDGLGHDRYAAMARFGSELAKVETQTKLREGVGTVVFDAAGAAVASPFRLVDSISRQ